MRSLFHQTTLTITAVLVLISCAIQAQVIGGSNLYARNYIEQRAINEGISNVQWKGGVGGVVSYAKLTYGEEPAYMTCTPINIEKAAFDALMTARNRGVNKEYRNYVRNPLKSIPVPAGPAQPAGNCFIYRNISGLYLEQFIHQQNYLDRLVTLNQVLPQILKGFIYLYNVGITNIKIDLNDISVIPQNNGQLKVKIVAFEVTERPQPPTNQLYTNIAPAKINPGSPSPYACTGYHEELYDYISSKINLEIAANPLNITHEDHMRIVQYIKQAREADLAYFPMQSKATLEQAVAAYISVLQITTIATRTRDCSSFAVALRRMLVQAQQAHQPQPQLL